MRFVPSPNLDLIVSDIVRPDLFEVAEKIAEGTARSAQDSDYKASVHAEETATGAKAVTFDPFAHLDEWGSVNNPPTGAMRRAAADNGRFVVE